VGATPQQQPRHTIDQSDDHTVERDNGEGQASRRDAQAAQRRYLIRGHEARVEAERARAGRSEARPERQRVDAKSNRNRNDRQNHNARQRLPRRDTHGERLDLGALAVSRSTAFEWQDALFHQ
jgi:hypothetical protein